MTLRRTSWIALKLLQQRLRCGNKVRATSRPPLQLPCLIDAHTNTRCFHPWFRISITTFSTETNQSEKISEVHQQLDVYDEKMLNELLEYKERHGDCHVPSGLGRFAQQERQRLGVSQELAKWVLEERKGFRHAQGKKGKLDDYLQVKIVLLESIGFMWSDREAQWQRNYNRLEKYARENNGDLNVDKAHDMQLGRWIDKQRRQYQEKRLSEQRMELLNDLGFAFDVHDAKWWEFHAKLEEYLQENGDTLVPADYPKDPPLGNWVSRQRRLYGANDLQEDRIKALEDINFSWNVLNDNWDRYYSQLCEFYEENGHCRVPTSDRFLWDWVNRQRRQLRQLGKPTSEDGKNTIEMIDALNKMDFDWTEQEEAGTTLDQVTKDRAQKLMELPFNAAIHEDLWIENFRKLCAFKDRYGHFAVPYSGVYAELSRWVRHQRFLFKRNKLPQERVAVLDDIDFVWTAQAARWDRLYEELMLFYGENGHTRIPTRNTELYRWTNQQRKALKAKGGIPEILSVPPSSKARLKELEKLLLEEF